MVEKDCGRTAKTNDGPGKKIARAEIQKSRAIQNPRTEWTDGK